MHGDLGHAIGAAVELLLFRREAVDVEFFFEWLSGGRGERWFVLETFGERRLGRQLAHRRSGARRSLALRWHGCWRRASTGDSRHLRFKWGTRASLDGRRNKASHDIKHGRNRGGGTLRAKHSGKRVGGTAAGASGNDIAYSLVQFVGGALDAFEILAQGAGDGLVDGVGGIGIVWHAAFVGRFARFVILEGVRSAVNCPGGGMCVGVPLLGMLRFSGIRFQYAYDRKRFYDTPISIEMVYTRHYGKNEYRDR